MSHIYSGHTFEDHPCCDCARTLRAWRWRGVYSHIGGDGPHATLLKDGTYICNSCQRERVRW